MFDVAILPTLANIDRAAWDACFPGEIEGYDYLLTIERAGLPGFSFHYVVARERGAIVAAAPAFVTEYPLETTLTGVARRLVETARRAAREALTLRLACIGSPCAESALIGFAPSVAKRGRADLLRALLEAHERAAREARCGLIAIKDVPAANKALLDDAARPLGYRAISGQAGAHIDIDFADIDAYLARLSAATRKDMRRKLKTLDHVRIELRGDLEGVESAVFALYEATRARADMTFEDLTPAYFTGVLDSLGARACCVLYWAGEELLAANLLLLDGERLLDKFFVMSTQGRQHNLYFLSWFNNLRLCLGRGLRRYECGQAGYETKLRLGCTLTPSYLYFRHRNAFINGALQIAAPLMSMSQAAAAP